VDISTEAVTVTRKVFLEKISDEIERGSFRQKAFSNGKTSEVILEKNPASFTVKVKIVIILCCVLPSLFRESKINRETLERAGCFHGGTFAICFRLFRLDTNGAVIHDWIRMFELRHAVDIFVSIKEITITWMSQTLIPKKLSVLVQRACMQESTAVVAH
jgi:hypothetical protein